jgi:hypothetical protein
MDASLPAMIAASAIIGIVGYTSWARLTYKARLLNAYYRYRRYKEADLDPCIIISPFGPKVVKFCSKSMESYLDILKDEYGEWHEFRWTTPQAYSRAIRNTN